MVKTVGPAVGSKGQIGFKEESKWGHPSSPPNKFFEFTSEGLVSEYTNLVSASLRADRGVHKQRTGTETAGGDINFEVVPEGQGTMFKHALGRKLTIRKDIAFVIVYTGGIDTDREISVSSNSVSSSGTTGGDDFDVAINPSETLQDLITIIDSQTNHNCYAPWGDGTTGAGGGYFAQAIGTKASASSTLGSADFDSSILAKSSGGVTNLEDTFDAAIALDDGNDWQHFPVYLRYGVYEHTLDADPELPQGMTLEVGRDVAAFNYYGGRVNTLAMTLNPGEIVTSTVNVMCKGGSTVGDPAVVGTNTGWCAPVAALRYAGGLASANIELDMDGTREMFYFDHGPEGTEDVIFFHSFERPMVTHDGYYYDITTTNGFVEFLEHHSSIGAGTDYFDVSRKGGWDIAALSATFNGIASVDFNATTDVIISLAINAAITPLFRGNYIGTDAGESSTYYVDITTLGALDGTAGFKGSSDNTNWSAEQLITAGIWYNIFDENEVDTGFDVMWPENFSYGADDSDQVADDTWSVTTFKDEATGATYETEDPFTGFQGAVTLDKGDGSGAVSQGVMSATFTLNNNMFGDKFELGDRQRAALVPQRRTTEGTINLEFDDLDVFRMFVNGVAGDLAITLTSDEYIGGSSTQYALVLRFPNIKFSGTTPVIGGEEIITTDFPFTALYDDTNSIPDMRMVLTNGQNYI